MSWILILNQIIVVIGIPAIIAAVIMLGRKLEVLDRLEKSLDTEIRPDLKDVRERFFVLEGRMTNMFWASNK
jgi:hypothetical protein